MFRAIGRFFVWLFGLPGRLFRAMSLPGCVAALTWLFLCFAVAFVYVTFMFDQFKVPWQHSMTWGRAGAIWSLVFIIPVVVFYALRLWLEGDVSPFPDLDAAWKAGIKELETNGVLLKQHPVFLVMGTGNHARDEALFASSHLNFRVKDAPGGSSPIRWYATADAVYIVLTETGCLSSVAAQGDAPPSNTGSGGVAAETVPDLAGPGMSGVQKAPPPAAPPPKPVVPKGPPPSAAPRGTMVLTPLGSGMNEGELAGPASRGVGGLLGGRPGGQLAGPQRDSLGPLGSDSLGPLGGGPLGGGALGGGPLGGGGALTTGPGRGGQLSFRPGGDRESSAPLLRPAMMNKPAPGGAGGGAAVGPPDPFVDAIGTAPLETRVVGLTGVDASLQTRRLEYVCHLLAGARKPLCPVNGMLALLSLSVIRLGHRESVELQRALRADLATLRRMFQLRFPVTVLVTGLEEELGFRELVRRVGAERSGNMRFGKGFELWTAPTVPMVEALTAHACGAFESWTYALFREQGSLSKPGNARLYTLLCQVRRNLQPRLNNILTQAIASPATPVAGEQPQMFGGCYFGAISTRPDRQAFVRAVFAKLIEQQEDVEWTQLAIRRESRFLRMAYILIVLDAALGVALAAYIFRRAWTM